MSRNAIGYRIILAVTPITGGTTGPSSSPVADPAAVRNRGDQNAVRRHSLSAPDDLVGQEARPDFGDRQQIAQRQQPEGRRADRSGEVVAQRPVYAVRGRGPGGPASEKDPGRPRGAGAIRPVAS